MTEFVRSILAELRAFCSDLLEAGLAPSTQAGGRAHGTGPAAFSAVLRHVDALSASIPSLIASLDAGESQLHYETEAQTTPLRATLPRTPTAWESLGDRLLPRFWERVTPLPQLDPRPLGYVQFVLEHLTEEFADVRSRFLRHIEEARASRQGTSRFAQHELQQLTDLAAQLDHAAAQLSRCSSTLHLATSGRIRTTDRLPHPFPRAPSWAAFRRLADAIIRPAQFLPSVIRDLLERNDPPLADLPFLFQRWVGTRIVRELANTFHFRSVGSSIGPIFLGGCIRLRRDSTAIDIWCEPRLSHLDHPSGLSAEGLEATPDFVMLTPGQGGPDAFVLDATMSQDPTILESKTRYRERIAFRQFRTRAGVPGRHGPLSAWAAAPIPGATYNQLSRPDGSAGVVPMLPQSFNSEPLNEWLAEIVDHADAWQLLQDARLSERASLLPESEEQ